VLVPFSRRSWRHGFNGYRTGAAGQSSVLGGERPLGFIEVTARYGRGCPVSGATVRLGDFVTNDRTCRRWPRYVAW
jgi:hypothetical protein